MDFAFTTAPERVSASMCRPMAWEALRQGHRVTAVAASYVDGALTLRAEDESESLPADPFLYGHTGVTLAVSQGAVPGWRVDWRAELYDRELWIERMGEAMWNHDARILPLEQALAEWTHGAAHLCPAGADSGPKAFKGFCCDRSEVGFELPRAGKGNRLDPSMRVALSAPNAPSEEYRCVFIGGEHVASGRYLLDGRLSETSEAPASVVAFAQSSARVWTPGDYCVIDVGVKADRMGIVEYNSLHSSGAYSLSRERIVAAIANAWPCSAKPKPRAF